ncbi:siphovirus ReqiPepy6 Gp37-like family protein [Bacillus sp. ISL-46]|uniref:siphovirus ReqiPepy6 Gp37-like family protein n=1 Tax=Bacillus sp. ISL-46 TaxID=2819129 RepID=UPI001BE60DE8|nr:siphovirus ReqiPepy6 Gp37-like family protein [Bacillus sp. ISL-46]MBT2723044.1 siphovirus ReqiPepy6 Gp37-like family protein [Bacillus sp. ISL-46]
MYEIYVRDASFKRIGEITDFSMLDIIPRFNAVGSFALDLPTDCMASKELIKPKYGIIVKKDGKSIFSGNVTSRKRAFNSSNDTMTFGGVDDMAFLAARLAYPVPSADFSLADYDVRTGKAETIMKQYVDVNAGTNAPIVSRKICSIETDKGLGNTVTGRARFHTLLDLLTSIALSGGGLGFRVVQVDDSLQFQVYQPIDKTRSAFFSPLLGNLSSFEYSNDNPEANMVIVGGGGEGAARIIKYKQDNTSIVKFGRFETFVDQRNTTDVAELYQSIDEELINKAEKNSFNFTPVDTPQLAFSRDYGLGDKVSIVLTQPNEIVEQEAILQFISATQMIETQPEITRKFQAKLDVIQDIVREVKISITPDGDYISPVVGTEDSNTNAIAGIFDKMKKMTKRLSNLERG